MAINAASRTRWSVENFEVLSACLQVSLDLGIAEFDAWRSWDASHGFVRPRIFPPIVTNVRIDEATAGRDEQTQTMDEEWFSYRSGTLIVSTYPYGDFPSDPLIWQQPLSLCETGTMRRLTNKDAAGYCYSEPP